MKTFGEEPVTPDEAKSLEKHVTKCASRYMKTSQTILRLQWTLWVYQALMLPAVIYIILKLHDKV